MGPGVLVAEGRGVQAGVQNPTRPRVCAADFGDQTDRCTDGVADDIDGEVVLAHPPGEQVDDGVVGIDACPAGDADQGAGQLEEESWSSLAAAKFRA